MSTSAKIPQEKILYIESNTDGTVGGSHFSLLFLIEGLNNNVYSPIVLFYQKHRLIPRFQQAGCKVLLASKKKPLDMSKYFLWIKTRFHNELIVLILTIPLLIFRKGINYLKTFVLPTFHCWRILRRENISLIHLNNTILRPQEWIFASLFTKAKVIGHERGINNHFPMASLFWIHFLKYIICISNAVKTNLQKHGFPDRKLCLIYNGLDPDKFVPTLSKKEISRGLGIMIGCPVVGIVGNIKQWKGQEIVIRAMKFVKQSFNDVKCLIIGGISDGKVEKEYYNHLKKIIEDDGLEDNIIFTGYRNDTPSLINALDILIHASIAPEPFGRVLLEGMALSKPVISNNIGAGSEIIIDGKTGLIVKYGDEKRLADGIINLLQDPVNALEMGKQGRIRLEECFHVSNYVNQVENLYEKIFS